MNSIIRIAVAGLSAVLGCAACANGYSPSLAQAPLSFSETSEGDLVVSRDDEGRPVEFVALVGDFSQGVPGYDVVGGNALLPIVRRPPPQSALLPPLGGLVTASMRPGLDPALQAGVANGLAAVDAALTRDGQLAPAAGVNVANGLATAEVAVARPGGGLAPGLSLDVGQGLVTANLGGALGGGASPSVTADVGAAQELVGSGVAAGASTAGAVAGLAASTPGTAASVAASALPPDINLTRTLTTQGPLLGVPATAAQTLATAPSLAGGSVNSLVDALRRRP